MPSKDEEYADLSDAGYGALLCVGIFIILVLMYFWFHDVKPKGLIDIGPAMGSLLYFLGLALIMCWVLAKDWMANSKLPPGAPKNRNFLGVGLAGFLLYLFIVCLLYGGADSLQFLVLLLLLK